MTKIYFVRHGQSEANVLRVFAGHTDIELSELGKRQAKAVGEYLKDKGIEAIYSSPLKRAVDTAKPLSEHISKPVIPYDGIIEIFGGRWENMPFDVLGEKYAESYGLWLSDIGNSRCDGGESMQEVRDRMAQAIDELARKEDGKTIAIFAHAGCLRAFLSHCLKLSLSQMQSLSWVSNASVTELEYECGEFKVIEMDYCGHLGDMVSSLPSNV